MGRGGGGKGDSEIVGARRGMRDKKEGDTKRAG